MKGRFYLARWTLHNFIMKHINHISVFLGLLFFISPILSILMVHHITLSETIVQIDAGFLGEAQHTYGVQGPDINMQAVVDVVRELGMDVAIYQKVDSQKEIKAICFFGEFKNMPLLEGRFFEAKDFQPGYYLAVIGKDKQSELVIREGQAYYMLEDQEFEVIGVLGLEQDTAIDSTVFINGLAAPNTYNAKLFSLDYIGKYSLEDSQYFLDQMQSKYGETIAEISAVTATLSRIFPRILSARWFLGILACNVLCILVLSLEWKKRKIHTVCVKRLLGCGTGRLIRDICLEYLGIIGISGICSVVYCCFAYASYRRFLFWGILCILVLAFLFVIYMAASLMKKSIVEAVK